MTLTELAESRNEAAGARSIYLDITGMSCGMCSGRVQKALNRVDGVQASVDLATKTATIETESDITAAELCEVVREAGYGAEPRSDAPEVAAESARGPLQRLVGGVLGLAGSR
jgi:copper chaperone CopZ